MFSLSKIDDKIAVSNIVQPNYRIAQIRLEIKFVKHLIVKIFEITYKDY